MRIIRYLAYFILLIQLLGYTETILCSSQPQILSEECKQTIKVLKKDNRKIRRRNKYIEGQLEYISEDVIFNIVESTLDKLCDITTAIATTINTLDESFSTLLDNILEKECTTLNNINNFLSISEQIIEVACTTESNIENISSVLDTINNTSSLDKLCHIESILEVIDERTHTQLEHILSICDKLEIERTLLDQTESQIPTLQSTTESIVDKLCSTLEIVVNGTSSLDKSSSTLEHSDTSLSLHDNTICSKIDSSAELVSLIDVQCRSVTDILNIKTDNNRQILCEFVITQEDVPYSISAPGVYCVKEDLTFSTTVIQITNTQDVTLKIQNHTITTTTSGGSGVAVSDTRNVQILDGTFVGGIFNIFLGSDVSLVKIENCIFTQAFNSGLRIQGTSTFVKDCFAFDNSVHGFNPTLAVEFGTRDLTYLRCVAFRNGFAVIDGTGSGFRADPCNTVIWDCVSSGNNGNGFTIIEDGNIISCVATTNARGCVQAGAPEAGPERFGLIKGNICINAVISGLESVGDMGVFVNNIGMNTFRGLFTTSSASDTLFLENITQLNTEGVKDFPLNPANTFYYSTIAHNNTTNYVDIAPGLPVESSPISGSTGYWTNLGLP